MTKIVERNRFCYSYLVYCASRSTQLLSKIPAIWTKKPAIAWMTYVKDQSWKKILITSPLHLLALILVVIPSAILNGAFYGLSTLLNYTHGFVDGCATFVTNAFEFIGWATQFARDWLSYMRNDYKNDQGKIDAPWPFNKIESAPAKFAVHFFGFFLVVLPFAIPALFAAGYDAIFPSKSPNTTPEAQPKYAHIGDTAGAIFWNGLKVSVSMLMLAMNNVPGLGSLLSLPVVNSIVWFFDTIMPFGNPFVLPFTWDGAGTVNTGFFASLNITAVVSGWNRLMNAVSDLIDSSTL